MSFVLALALSAAAASDVTVAASPRFDAIKFFDGATEGSAQMKIALGPHHAVHVHGRGHVEEDGSITLDQTVKRAGRAPTNRTWRIRRMPATEDGVVRYTGSLIDAIGPIAGESIGDQLHLHYRGKGGIQIEQWLTLAPDGRSAANRLSARKMGMVVARLEETIRKTD